MPVSQLSQTARKPKTETQTLSFIDFLQTNLRDSPPRQKGERTRERIKIATAKILETKGYHAMRVVDITEAAEVAEGSFYVYFKDKKEASLTTMSSFIAEFVNVVAPTEAVHTPFDSIRAANRRWFALCRANSGLMRCVMQLGDQEPEFAKLVQDATYEWYLAVSENVRRERRVRDADIALFAVYFMGSMMEELVRKTITFPDKKFIRLLKKISANDNAVADAASLIWMRVFDAGTKIPKDLSPAAAKLAKLMRN